MIQKIRMLSAGLLLLAAQTFAQGTTRATRSGDNYTLSNGAVEAVFSGQGRFDIEKLTLNGKSVLGAGANLAPWILYYKGPQGENPCLMPEHAAYDGAAIRDDDEGKTLVFTWRSRWTTPPNATPCACTSRCPTAANCCAGTSRPTCPKGGW